MTYFSGLVSVYLILLFVFISQKAKFISSVTIDDHTIEGNKYFGFGLLKFSPLVLDFRKYANPLNSTHIVILGVCIFCLL